MAGIEIQPLECHHWSQIRLKDGSFISGVPMAFIVYADENVRFYHYGDTAIFSDLKLQAELYQPNVGCIGIANPQEILHLNPMPGEMMTGEMSPYEGVLATQWLGLETVLPCHYITLDGDPDVAEYMKHHRAAKARGEKIADPYLLRVRRLDRVRRGRQGRTSGEGGLINMRAAIFDAPLAIRMADAPSQCRVRARCWSR